MSREFISAVNSAFDWRTICTSPKRERSCLLRKALRSNIPSGCESRPGSGLGFRYGRTALELGQIGVPHVAQIFDSDFTGEEAIGGHAAQKGKEINPLA